MSNVVQFLESMGRHPALLSDADYTQAVMDAEVDEPSREALLRRDAKGLVHALDANSPMFCFSFVVSPDGDEKSPPGDDHTDEGEEKPDEEPALK
ncbi:hypothetical protein [Aerolutibacter ruishenii]|uniref:Uncharacterized protein n=1 Tax=Aerolutibacter ruishenii TaxID=686800 RepID=A0A562M168_9GAMM|nr:hypothetical protein [Lysobacter ruishenii]TWI13351.1 hypothetical protein IP93_00513 [Lysobacter ruishenii]